MSSESEADAAIEALRDTVLDGANINVERSHGGRSRYRSRRHRTRSRNRSPGPYSRPSRYGPSWDDRSYGSYGPPRGDSYGYDYPHNGMNGRYMSERDYDRPMHRSSAREPIPPPSGLPYRPMQQSRMPSPPREYGKPSVLPRPSYDSYGDYDRYREPASGPTARSNDYYDNYGSYNSEANYE